jgi:hypothetical protein
MSVCSPVSPFNLTQDHNITTEERKIMSITSALTERNQ